MSWLSNDIVEILTFLLPGFIAAAVFYSLTSHPRPSEFTSVVHALIFTMVVQAIMFLLPLKGVSEWLGSREGAEAEILVSVPVALAIGIVAAYVSNQDKLYAFLRWLRITRETSYPSEWYSSFAHHEGCYVVLHLQGDRRIYGWLEEWPSQPDKGHFRLAEADWLIEDSQSTLDRVSAIVIPASQVEMVEFVEPESRDESRE